MAEKTSTQQFLEINQIRDGVMILKNKTLRGVLIVSSVNFALKSVEEQNSIIYQFQDFLNSLDFSTQILCQSRKLNITGYLDKINFLEENQTNEMLRAQTKEYKNFIQNIVANQDILIKNFFVIIPYATIEATGLTIPGKKKESPQLTEEVFQRCKSQLWQRMEFAALGLRRCGLQAVPLTSPELIELFWSLHHPKESETGYYPEFPQELIT
ncbi:MAG: hypothetical protein KY054_02655 [Candidatus Nealsonbacteria bacterium]|nr:hypothetical protein [Candidatus Nealsonbacteria bacterium]